MSELNTIPVSGPWSDIQQLLNQNFANIAADLLGLKDASYRFRGVFPNKTSLPTDGTASNGDYALVFYANAQFNVYYYNNGWVQEGIISASELFHDWESAPLATSSQNGFMTSAQVGKLDTAYNGVGNLRTQVNNLITTVDNNKSNADSQISNLQTGLNRAMASIPYFDGILSGSITITSGTVSTYHQVLYSTTRNAFVAVVRNSATDMRYYSYWNALDKNDTAFYLDYTYYTRTKGRIYRTSGGLYTFDNNYDFAAFCDLVPKSMWNATMNRLSDAETQADTNKSNITALTARTNTLEERVTTQGGTLETLTEADQTLDRKIDDVAGDLSNIESTAANAATMAQAAQRSVESMEDTVDYYGGCIGELNTAVNTLNALFTRLRLGLGVTSNDDAIDKLIELYNTAFTLKS